MSIKYQRYVNQISKIEKNNIFDMSIKTDLSGLFFFLISKKLFGILFPLLKKIYLFAIKYLLYLTTIHIVVNQVTGVSPYIKDTKKQYQR